MNLCTTPLFNFPAEKEKRGRLAGGLGLLCILLVGVVAVGCDLQPQEDSRLTIVSHSPESGDPGTEVTIRGKGFGSDASEVTVTIGGTSAPILDVTNTKLEVEVPNGATDGTLKVTVGEKSTTTTPEFDVLPSGKIAFYSDRTGSSEIYSMNADGTDQTQLTSYRGDGGNGLDIAPEWSPDGSQIAFMSVRNAETDIYKMNADGSSVTRLTTSVDFETSPTWAPDGESLMYTRGADGPDIYRISADGLNPEFVTNTGDGVAVRFASWSPGEERFVFSIYEGDAQEIGTGNTKYNQQNGFDYERLMDNAFRDSRPAWSPDGERIAFVSERNGSSDIYTMNTDGSGVQRVTDSPAVDTHPTWSPDGDKLAFASDRDGDDSDIYIIDRDGTNLERITTGTSEEGDPDWVASE